MKVKILSIFVTISKIQFYLLAPLVFLYTGCASNLLESANPLDHPTKHDQSEEEIQLFSGNPKPSANWVIETLVTPPPIISAPFDLGILPNGMIILDGPSGELVALDETGTIKKTGIPSGGPYFSITKTGEIWYYHMFEGKLSLYNPRTNKLSEIAHFEEAFSTGSISVTPDGDSVYFSVGTTADNTKSVVYRYTRQKGLETIAEGAPQEYMVVEVSPTGEVFLGGQGRILVYKDGAVLPRAGRPGTSPLAMTSAPDGTLYYSATGTEGLRGIYRIRSNEKKSECILPLPSDQSIPNGLAWDPVTKRLLALQKEEHQVSLVESQGLRGLIDAEMISTPIAIALDGEDNIFINGDEVGVQRVDKQTGKVNLFCKGLVSFQPPPSGMAFSKEGDLFYVGSAPGMPSIIYRIKMDGQKEILWEGHGRPCGIALSPKGDIYITDYERNGLYALRDGMLTPIRNDLPHPVGLTMDKQGYFYAAVAEKIQLFNRDSLQDIPRTRIVTFSLKGPLKEVASFPEEDISFFDLDDENNLYVPLGDTLIKISPKGQIQKIASGFGRIRDVKIMENTSLVVSDYLRSAVYIVRPSSP